MAVPQTFASQILGELVRAEIAVSKAGREGGYRLALPPEKIAHPHRPGTRQRAAAIATGV